MGDEDKAIMETLVSVVWADGEFADREREMLDALLACFAATDEEAAALRDYAATPRTLDDIPLTELSAGARRTVLQHAVVLSWVDGEQGDAERALLARLSDKLHIPSEEAQSLMGAADERAKRLLALLASEEQ